MHTDSKPKTLTPKDLIAPKDQSILVGVTVETRSHALNKTERTRLYSPGYPLLGTGLNHSIAASVLIGHIYVYA